jgi:hypothetical protein
MLANSNQNEHITHKHDSPYVTLWGNPTFGEQTSDTVFLTQKSRGKVRRVKRLKISKAITTTAFIRIGWRFSALRFFVVNDEQASKS